MKIIKIDGFRGLLFALLTGICLFAGFVVFPGKVAMHFWNLYLVNLCAFPKINLFQGTLLWGMTIVSYLILSKKGFGLSFENIHRELSDRELNMLMKNARVYTKMKQEAYKKLDTFSKSNIPLEKSEDISSVVNSHKKSTQENSDKVTSDIK